MILKSGDRLQGTSGTERESSGTAGFDQEMQGSLAKEEVIFDHPSTQIHRIKTGFALMGVLLKRGSLKIGREIGILRSNGFIPKFN